MRGLIMLLHFLSELCAEATYPLVLASSRVATVEARSWEEGKFQEG